MKHPSAYQRYRESLPQDSSLTEEDEEKVQAFLSDSSTTDLMEWAEERTKVYEIGGQNFRMVVDRPKDANESQSIVVGGEFANGIVPLAIARARIVRDIVAPEASLVYQPNSNRSQQNMNFSSSEQELLLRGNLAPMMGRLGLVLDSLKNPEDLMLHGPSQGGVIALEYASLSDTPAASVAVIEVPNLLDRSFTRLTRDFFGCGKQFGKVLRDNYGECLEGEPNDLQNDLLRASGTAALLLFALGFPRRDNLALTGVLRRDTAQRQISSILDKGGSVVQAYGTVDSVSPVEANEEAMASIDSSRYEVLRFEGADHSMTNNYVLNTALARRARDLKEVV